MCERKQFIGYEDQYKQYWSIDPNSSEAQYFNGYRNVATDEPMPESYAEIDLSVVEENVARTRRFLGDERVGIIAVTKADAMGLGTTAISQTVQRAGVDKIAVSTPQEVRRLRTYGIDVPLLLLYPPSQNALPSLIKSQAEITITDIDTVQKIGEISSLLQMYTKVQLQLETGFHHVGAAIDPHHLLLLMKKLQEFPLLSLEGVFIHFATAEVDLAESRAQLGRFMDALRLLSNHGYDVPTVHIANSRATTILPESWDPSTYEGIFGTNPRSFIRPGGLITGEYGDNEGIVGIQHALRSVISRVKEVKKVSCGESIGYDHAYVTDSDIITATIPLGWGDHGFNPQSIPKENSSQFVTQGEVLINGARRQIFGFVGSSNCTVSADEAVHSGDVVTILGDDGSETITIDDITHAMGLPINTQAQAILAGRLAKAYYR